jgi:hypothetical protein
LQRAEPIIAALHEHGDDIVTPRVDRQHVAHAQLGHALAKSAGRVDMMQHRPVGGSRGVAPIAERAPAD